MATISLRPAADSSLSHSTSASSSGYLLINDITADDNTSYIYQSITSKSSESVTSSFTLNQQSLLNLHIEAITFYVRAMCTESNDQTATIAFTCAGKTKSATNLSNSYSNYTLTLSASDLGLTNTIEGKVNLNPITFSITTAGAKDTNKKDDFDIRVTQAYLVIRYTPILPIFDGDIRASEIYVGDKLVSEIYKGTTKIYGIL